MKYLIYLLIVSSLLFSENLEKIKLQLQWKHQFEFAGFYIAKEKGYYKELGLDVDFIEFKEGMDITQEVISGNADYGLSFSSIIVDYFNNKPIVMVANFLKQSPLVLVTQENIKTLNELKNKKVMGLLDSTHKRTILTMLDKYNISKNDFKNVPRKFVLDSFIKKEVDAISIFSTNEIYTLNKLGIKYNIFDPAVFATKFYDLNLFTTKDEVKNNHSRVEKFKKASIKGWQYALKNKEETINLILNKYNTQNKTKESLMFEANQIEYLMLSNLYPIGSIDIQQLQIIADNFAQSHFMAKQSKETIKEFVYVNEPYNLKLTSEQKNYLKNKQKIKMCVDPNWMPLEMIKDKKHAGIAADFINIISNELKIPFELVTTKTWTESIEKIKKHQCDILPLAQVTPSKQEYLNFTTPYITTPLVIVTKTAKPFINDLEVVKNKKIAIVKNYSIFEILKNKYPYINFVEVDSIIDGLNKVKKGKVFGLIDTSIVINHELFKKYAEGLTISGQLRESCYLSIASRNDEGILNEIMEKVLSSIDSKKKNEILNKWTYLNYNEIINYQMIINLLIFFTCIVILFIYWNLKLTKEIKNRKIIEEKLRQSEEKFRILFDIAPILLNQFDENGKIVFWNKECEKVFGYDFKEIKNMDNPLEVFYPNPDMRKKVIHSFQQKDGIYKEWHPLNKYGNKLATMWANIELPTEEVINFGFDITKQREDEYLLNKAKIELEKLNNSLEDKIKKEIEKNTQFQITLMEQNKLAQMGEMIENIAHQWRQPLAEINSSVLLLDAILDKKGCFDSNIEKKLYEIEQLTEYMSNTINDFKNFFELDKKKEKFNLYESFSLTLKIIKGRLSLHKIAVDINIDKDLNINSYMNELNQVFLVILNNSIDAIIKNKIEIPLISIEVKEIKNEIIISIEDNAKGVDEHLLGKIFEPYFTTKHKSQGTGLGLYISKMIIEKGLNGTITASNNNLGICFIIKLPKGEV
ncbi:ABC transporter substrate-binding protein [Halarcobacter sp.]|uniref:ABC transporter substrate-binding protein n=1 Tax=Halarcobacter sp. TaxID=2321133 RepID=UPI0029F47812|nr:ABC transporter substrate-binding protein [Halarcobacter sp.]